MPKHAIRRSLEDAAISRDSGLPGRPRKSVSKPKMPTENVRYEREVIGRKEMKRIEMHDFSCRCLFMVRPIKMESTRCGLCGTAVVHPYKHFKLLQPSIGEILGDVSNG